MSDVQRQQADYLRQRRDGDREARFKIHRNIPKITAEGAVSLLDEFDAVGGVRADESADRLGMGHDS